MQTWSGSWNSKTIESGRRISSRIRSRCSACAIVRGKPSRTKPSSGRLSAPTDANGRTRGREINAQHQWGPDRANAKVDQRLTRVSSDQATPCVQLMRMARRLPSRTEARGLAKLQGVWTA